MERHNNITLLGITNFLEHGALLRRGNQWVLIEGPFRPLAQPSEEHLSVYFPDFYDPEAGAYWVGNREWTLEPQQLKALYEEYLSSQMSPSEPPQFEEPLLADFEASLRSIQDKIKSGEIQKAVPVVFAKAPGAACSTPLLARTLLKLLEAPASLFVFGFWQKGEGVLGATPETLFSYSQGQLQTMALAGTCPREDKSRRISLLEDPKERQEHELVREDLHRVLQQYGRVEMSEPFILELPTLLHLKSDIRVECSKPPHFKELLMSLHPTPALGVAPRSYGYKWMAPLPGQEGRRGFGAPFAFMGPEFIQCVVAIRCVQWFADRVQVGSGCGVVLASQLEQEWRELAQKRFSVQKIMGWI